jgi:HlyD family secretion protein
MKALDSSGRTFPIVPIFGVAVLAGLAGWGIREFQSGGGHVEQSVREAEAAVETRTLPAAVTALGRLEPKDHVRRVAGPSNPSVVIARLMVEEGDWVQQGQIIAELDNHEVLKATVAGLRAQLEHAQNEYSRNDRLYRNRVVSDSERDNWKMQVQMGEAELQRAEAEFELAEVRAPIGGQVLKIHTRPGERVGADGIAEIGQTDRMYAIAEVYETDIGNVKVGQRALITSPALPEPMHGTVEKIGLEVAKNDVLNVDPVAKTDARVVEVEVRLDEHEPAAGLTNLQVEVAISPVS